MKEKWSQEIEEDYRLIICERCGRIFKCLGRPDCKGCSNWDYIPRYEPTANGCLCPNCLSHFYEICRCGGFVDEEEMASEDRGRVSSS